MRFISRYLSLFPILSFSSSHATRTKIQKKKIMKIKKPENFHLKFKVRVKFDLANTKKKFYIILEDFYLIVQKNKVTFIFFYFLFGKLSIYHVSIVGVADKAKKKIKEKFSFNFWLLSLTLKCVCRRRKISVFV